MSTRRWSGALGALLLAAGAAVTAVSAPAVAAGPGQVDLTLLNINDWHGRIDGNTVRFAGTIESLRAASGEANTVLLSAGDNIGASLFASAVDKDQPTIDILNALDLKVSAVGNHEFDLGFADLRDRVIAGGTNAKWSYLGANVYDAATGVPVLPEYAVLDVAGIKVGVIGAVTDETPSLVSPAGVAGLTFGDPVDAVNRVAAQLSDGDPANGEAQVIVAEYHDGAGAGLSDGATFEQEVAAGGTFADIVNLTSGQVDAIFTGHTHKEYAWDGPVPGQPGRTRPIVQTGSYGDRIGKVVLTVDQASGDVVTAVGSNVNRVTTPDLDLIAAYPRVAAVKTIVDAANARATAVGSVQVGSLATGADITTAFSGGTYVNGVYTATTRDDRAKESTLGNLVADSMVAMLSAPDKGGAEIGVVNPGGLRNELRYAVNPSQPGDGPGVITFAEANAVLPFANSLFTETLTGAQVKIMLEQQWQRDANGAVPSRPYLQLGLSKNVSYTFDPTRPEGDRITSITVNGAPIDPARGYRIGTFSFLAEGGDNFWVFRAGTDQRDSGLIDRDAWNDFLTANSPVSPSFARRAVQVSSLPTTTSVGANLTFGLAGLDLTSLGSPLNTSVALSIGGTSLGTVPVTAGAASVDVLVPVGTPLGAQSLTATASPSGTVVTIPLTVVDPRTASTTTLTAGRTTQTYGGPSRVTFTAKVTLADGSVPTGSVDLVAGGSTLATVALVDGAARYTLPSTTPAGTYAVTAVFAGSNTVKASTSAPVTVTVRKADSFTLLLANRDDHRRDRPVTLTAFVFVIPPVPATGTVTFKRNGVAIATVPVTSGRASYTLPSSAATGTATFTAEYSGAASIDGSRSNGVRIRVR